MDETRFDVSKLPLPESGRSGWPWIVEPNQFPDNISDGSLWPRISLVTPSFNQGRFIEETIRSVLLQGYPNLQYIIMDGQSTDNSVEIIKKYQPYLSYWVSEPDNGQTYAIQKGMQIADGEIVNWLNADDFLLPQGLFHIAEQRLKIKVSSVFCGNAIHVNSDSKFLFSSKVNWADETHQLLPSSPPIHGGIQASWFVAKDLWDKVGGLNLSLDYTMDTDLYYRCFEKGAKFVLVDQDVAAYRAHDDTKTQKGWKKSLNYKKSFYYSRCNQLPEYERIIYLPRIRRFLCTQFLKSISPKESFTIRLRKFIGAFKEYPEYFLVPYQVKIALKKLIVSS